ncbi:MAG: acyl-CoA dehydratase activase [Clostridia bacterium]|nr:acyl-CoA dehydratase activase [Clostridia bacterium]MDD4146636.1 acyl-CoA dehydratase activase [Clostridia bacterium]MDD4666046.1 acyl-CoA dehydratase activase [Clostridia bacterium]
MKKAYLGVDVGSVSTNMVVADEKGEILESLYIRTMGQPVKAVQSGLKKLGDKLKTGVQIMGVGVTGSARNLSAVLVGADVVKNEITAHAVAVSQLAPGAQTIIEIGGQDSKIIIMRDGVVTDFAMNTVCAAGTGSFLDQQAARLNIPIERFGELALKAHTPVRIAGRCAVFAESDMVHKQQLGHSVEDIIAGLCEALVRNYLNNVGKGKEILAPVVFQGGVAANVGIKAAFEKTLHTEVNIPKYYDVMGSVGCCYLAREATRDKPTKFKGWQAAEFKFRPTSFECQGCPNMCEVIQIYENEVIIARWGDRCGKWSNAGFV